MDPLSYLLNTIFPVFNEIIKYIKLRDIVSLSRVNKCFQYNISLKKIINNQSNEKITKIIERYYRRSHTYILKNVYHLLKDDNNKEIAKYFMLNTFIYRQERQEKVKKLNQLIVELINI